MVNNLRLNDVPDNFDAIVVHGKSLTNFTPEDWNTVLAKKEVSVTHAKIN